MWVAYRDASIRIVICARICLRETSLQVFLTVQSPQSSSSILVVNGTDFDDLPCRSIVDIFQQARVVGSYVVTSSLELWFLNPHLQSINTKTLHVLPTG